MSINNKLRYEILARDGFRCKTCGRTPDEIDVVLEVDHIVPASLGGTNDPENLRVLCRDCNGGRSNDYMPDDSGEVKVSDEFKSQHKPVTALSVSVSAIYDDIPEQKPTLAYAKKKTIPNRAIEEVVFAVKLYLMRNALPNEPFTTKTLGEKINRSTAATKRILLELEQESVIEVIRPGVWRYLG